MHHYTVPEYITQRGIDTLLIAGTNGTVVMLSFVPLRPRIFARCVKT